MGSRMVLVGLAVGAVGFAAAYMNQAPNQGPRSATGFHAETSPKRKDKVKLSDWEWRKRLTPAQFKILRSHGTEPAFCGIFHDHKEKGTYFCAGCDLPLFKDDAKFNSGTGWPSFFQPFARENIWTRTDRSYNMLRHEVLCARCDGHLGHVFDDAPDTPTGLRFCINSDALVFRKQSEIKEEKPVKDGE
ncbi:MAG: peptide-methionine (R)-S-oxide reductase MsrB [Fimbriimonas sp.]